MENQRYKQEPIIFTDKVKKNNETLFVSIPIKDAKYLGIETGDNVRVWIKKIEE